MAVFDGFRTFMRLNPSLSEKPVQMKFYLPNEATKLVLDRRRYDLATLQDKSLSEVTVDALMSSLLPSAQEAIEPVSRVLLGDRGEEGEGGYVTANVLAGIFDENCDGSLGRPKHTNFLPLVGFAHDYLARGSNWGEEQHMLQFRREAISYWRILLSRVEAIAPKSFVERRIVFENTVDLGREMLRQLEDGSAPPYPFNFVRLIRDCWDVLYNDANAYRFIASTLKSVVIFREDLAEQRNDFQVSCEQVMSCWGDAAAERRDTLATIAPKAGMKTIDLANGDVCRVPTDFLVMGVGSASSATNAIVCEVPEFERFRCPNHMLFFADCDLVKWREDGNEELAISIIKGMYPALCDPEIEYRTMIFDELPDGPSCGREPPYCAAIYRRGWDS